MDFNFEAAMKRLSEISSRMSDSATTLDESMKLYNEAAELIKKCGDYLDSAKLIVEQAEYQLPAKVGYRSGKIQP